MAHRSTIPRAPAERDMVAAGPAGGNRSAPASSVTRTVALVTALSLVATVSLSGAAYSAPAPPDATISALNADMARFSAIGAYTTATQALAATRVAAANAVAAAGRTVAANQALAAQASAAEGTAVTLEKEAVAAADAATSALNEELDRMSSLALALYVRADVGAGARPPDLADTAATRTIMLGILLNHTRAVLRTDRQTVTDTAHQAGLAHARTGAATAAAARAATAVLQAQAGQAHAATDAAAMVARASAAVTAARLTATGAAPAPAPSGGLGPDGPTILGPSTLTAGELAGWFAAKGWNPVTTVPLAVLAGFYISAGQAEGVRGDVAFAQSVIETGHFSFPAGGQLTGTANNFAGIGACDSCSQGWSFPDAQTGVRAQLQLLHAYASTRPVDTSLVGSVGVSGCCPTWMALTGVWATATTYGTAILGLYLQMVEWALPLRMAAAGL